MSLLDKLGGRLIQAIETAGSGVRDLRNAIFALAASIVIAAVILAFSRRK